MLSTMAKKTRGRQKIEIKKIENEEVRQVTFSKRKTGLFKKASELASLCGAKILLLVYSPAGRPFSFSQPDFYSVLNRFISPTSAALPEMVQKQRSHIAHQLDRRCTDLENQIEEAKGGCEELKQHLTKTFQGQEQMWNSGLKGLDIKSLEKLAKDLEALKQNVDTKVANMLSVGASSSQTPISADPVTNYGPLFGHNMVFIPNFSQEG